MTATVWSLDLYDRAGASVLTPLPFMSLKATWQLNAPGTLEFDLQYQGTPTYVNMSPGIRTVKLSRSATVIWGGDLSHLSANAESRTVRGEADGWWAKARQRVIDADLIYTDTAPTSQQQIAWDIINHFQGQSNGSLSFTQGTHTGATVNRNRHYCGLTERPNAGQAVEDFTDLDDGFDFEIDPATRQFNTWSPQRKTDLTGSIILNETNLMSLDWEESTRDMANTITGLGADDCGPIADDIVDATLQATYGRLQDIVQSNRNEASEIDAQAREELRIRKRPLFTAHVAFYETAGPAWGTYALGDLVTLAPTKYFSTFNRPLRISGISLSLEAGGSHGTGTGLPFYELELTNAKD